MNGTVLNLYTSRINVEHVSFQGSQAKNGAFSKQVKGIGISEMVCLLVV